MAENLSENVKSVLSDAESVVLVQAHLISLLAQTGPHMRFSIIYKNHDQISFPRCKSYSQLTCNSMMRCYVAGQAWTKYGGTIMTSTVKPTPRYVDYNPNETSSQILRKLNRGLLLWNTVDKVYVQRQNIKPEHVSLSTMSKLCQMLTMQWVIHFLEHTVYLPCRTIPVNWVNVTSMPAFALKETNIPFSADFMTMREILNASLEQDVLNNIVSPIIRDVASILTLTKWLIANNKKSMHEHAAFLRCLCMLMSIDSDVYDYDPIKYTLIRRERRGADKPRVYINLDGIPKMETIAVPLDTALSIAINNFTNSSAMWSYDELDSTWIMVPIKSDTNNNILLPYIVSYMSNVVWGGSVSWSFDMVWQNADWVDERARPIVLMPKINSSYISGALRVMIVLLDCSSQNTPASVEIYPGTLVPVYVNSQINPVDISDAWKKFYSVENMGQASARLDSCLTEFCSYVAVGNTSGVVLSMAAEMYGCWHPGLYSDPSTEKHVDMTWNGAWAFKGNSQARNIIDKRDGHIEAKAWHPTETTQKQEHAVANEDWCSRITGFNFSLVLPWHRMASAYTVLNVRQVTKTRTKDNVWEETQIVALTAYWDRHEIVKGTPGYCVKTMSSIMRLCVGVGLLSHGQTYQFNNAYVQRRESI